MENKLILFLSLISINVLTVLSFNHLFSHSGAPCSVSSLMPVTQSVQLMKGTCHSSLLCRHKGGEAIGRCGITDVCCVFPRSCGDASIHNSTYFINPGYPLSYNFSNTCLLTIHRISSINRICQLRLDFIDFELSQPNEGECDIDFLTVNGQNLNSVVPKICGFNSGQHLYVDIDGVQGPIKLNVQTYGKEERRWNVLVSQIECNNPSKAPPNCLQYYIEPNGVITGFNYNNLLQTNPNEIRPIFNSRGIGKGYFNNLDYSICFRKEQYFCTQSYSINTSNSVNSANDQSLRIYSEWVSPGHAGAGMIECNNDYILLNGIRFCGERLNSEASDNHKFINFNEEITDNGSGPFIARFVSDKDWSAEINRGFKLSFKQKPCLLQSPNSHSVTVQSVHKTEAPTKLSKQQFNPKMCKVFKSKDEV